MALSSPPITVAPFDKGRLAAGISAAATTCTVSPIYKTVAGVRVKQGLNTTSGCAIISQGDFNELITYTGLSVDSTTKVSTITGMTRGRDPTQTTAAGSFASGTGRVWAKGAKFTVVDDVTYNQAGVYKNVANTFTATQAFAGATFSEAPTFAKGTHNSPFADATARDAYFSAPTNGDEAYTTGIGKQVYSAGAWVTTNASGTSFASTSAAGTLEAAVVAEQASHAAAGGTGALAVPTTNNLVTLAADPTWISGAIPTLNTEKFVDGSLGGTGVASPVLGALLIGGGAGAAMTPIGPGAAGQVPVSTGSTIAMTSGYTDWVNVLKNVTLDSHALTASETYALQAQYTVPATMAAGTSFRFFYAGTYNMNATGSFIKFNLGSTTVNIQDSANATTDNAYFIRGWWTCVSTGGSGSFIYYIESRHNGATTVTASTTATTIDTTATNLFKLTVVGGGGGAAPTIKNSVGILDRLN